MPYNKPKSRTGTGSFFTHQMIQPVTLDKNGNYHYWGDAYRVARRTAEQIYPTSQNFLGNMRHNGKYYKKRVRGTTQRVTAKVTLEVA